MSNYLIIDLSYYNFYRFYATKNWYSFAFRDEEYEPGYDWSENIIFMEKFTKMFLENIKKYQKKFNIDTVYFAKDCKRKDIWRVSHYNGYKGTREETYTKKKFMGGKVFQKCYENIIPSMLNDNVKEIKINNLEADDIIYLLTNKILEKNNDVNIYIISSDHDLLQIIDGRDNIHLYTANLKCYNCKSKGSADLDRFCKAMLGDPSDNIPKVFKRMGEKTAIKLYNNPNLLEKKFNDNPETKKQYDLNRLLIDFSYIPQQLIDDFNEKII